MLKRRSRGLFAWLGAAAVAFAVLVALGWWQLERRQWKLALIARVDARIHAAPVPAPGPGAWSTPDDAYRHVTVTGRFDAPDTLVQAVSEFGNGYWVLTPMHERRGFAVLVNRGFVANADLPIARPEQWGSITGLLRSSEPGGAFLHRNDAAAVRWYSRDVAAIARARGLGTVAPYFIDAEAVAGPATRDVPVGGLTVVQFANNHLVYAFTWFALAAMVAGGAIYLVRSEARPIDKGDASG